MPKKSKKTLDDSFSDEGNHWQEELKKFKPLKSIVSSKKNNKPDVKPNTNKLVEEPKSVAWESVTKNFKPLPSKYKNIAPKTLIKNSALALSKQPIFNKHSNFTNYSIQITNKKDLRKIKSNKIVVSKTLDLHSYNLHDAKNYFYEFIRNAVANNYKLVQVITGKGNNSKDEKGVLRSALIEWLTDEKLKPYVLSYSPIYDSTGSYGAFYIFLRKSIKNS